MIYEFIEIIYRNRIVINDENNYCTAYKACP